MCLETELISTADFHFLPGRFRVAVPSIKGNPAKAELLAERLEKVVGVAGYANPLTGRLLLLYDPHCSDPYSLLDTIARIIISVNQFSRVERKESLPSTLSLSENGNMAKSLPWHSLKTSRVLEFTGSSPQRGLSNQTAWKRLQIYGPNQLKGESKKTVWSMFGESFRGFMPKLLLGAAAVSLFVGEKSDAVVITGIVILQAALETIQGYRAEKSLEALKELSAPRARVIREGRIMNIAAEELVFGDLIQLEAGDLVPADARILESDRLLTDESCLTGESIPVAKELTVLKNPRLFTADRLNMLFAGTSIIKGKVWAVVIATGMHTEMGRIATLLGQEEREKTLLHRQMELLGRKTTRLVLFSVGAIIVVGLLQRKPLVQLLNTGVSLAVGAIPEGLPAVVTVALAFGVQRMARRNAIVRRLAAVETLGGVTAICSDKTGTLTANEMTVKKLYAGGKIYAVGGQGYRPVGDFYHQGQLVDPDQHSALNQVLFGGAVCNNAKLLQKTTGQWTVSGDPTEGALLALAAKGNIWPHCNQEFCRQKEISFDPSRRMMSVLGLKKDGSIVVYAKGAPESLLQRCQRILRDDRVVPLDSFQRQEILKVNGIMAGEALRVLSLAAKVCQSGQEDPEENLIFLGLVGMVDPPRHGVKKAIEQCQKVGIKVLMVTGDHQATAEAVGQQLGLLDQGTVLSGRDLEQIPLGDLAGKIGAISVFARTSPEQKLRIVRALQEQGQIVAMTGDGINDAPAVKEADIGIAMGLSGTDVTRQAAGIVLSDDNFASIVAGVEEGRAVASNIGKAARYILPGNWGQVFAVFLASVSGYAAPLVPSQILWINLVTESLPAMALAADPPSGCSMADGPCSFGGELFSGKTDQGLLYRALLAGLTTYGLYAGGLSLFGWNKNKARTMAFSHVILNRTFSIFDGQPGEKPTNNPYLLPAAGFSALMLAAALYFPGLNPVFKTVPLGISDWALLAFSAGILGRLDSYLLHKNGKN